MELITIASVIGSFVIVGFIAYAFGKEQGKSEFKQKLNDLTVRQMLAQKKERFKNL